mmetsp:Transcript_1088/g.1627  ORF Transcript_1088/g.1627 Transcript_1088/m.1627 type:complete len:424 (-) Transcript_1088:62-1333(-)
MEALSARIAALEGAEAHEGAVGGRESAARDRVAAACSSQGVVFRMYGVAADYYSLPLEERARAVHAPGPQHLCKSVLLKNCAWEALPSGQDARNAEYYLVVVQYCEKLVSERVGPAVRNLLPEELRLPKNKYSFRLATQEESDKVCGFEHNAVAPVGLADSSVPLIVCSEVLQLDPPVIWLGGGEVDIKLQVNAPQFIEATGAFVLPLSEKRELDDLPKAASEKSVKSAPPAAPDSEKEPLEAIAKRFDQLELKVGKIIHAERHPESDKLLVETIDIGEVTSEGEPAPRQILSGIAKYYTPEDIINKMVVVMTNLKPAKLAGLASAGMVMCAKNEAQNELRIVEPPSDAPLGARVALKGCESAQSDPASAAQMKKKKIVESLLPDLAVNNDMEACFATVPWVVPAASNGSCTCETIVLPACVA